jgi:hypothetical protein
MAQENYHLNKQDCRYIWDTMWRALANIEDAVWQGEYPFDISIINLFSGKHGRHRFNWALPRELIAAEVDGWMWLARGGRHGAVGKLAIAASLGWLVFRFSPQMLQQYPQVCVGLVEQSILLRRSHGKT